jgi:hypothetical protein
LWLGVKAGQTTRALPIWPLAVIGFFMVLLRSTNVLLLCACALLAFHALSPPATSLRDPRRVSWVLRNVAPAALGAIAGEIVQIAYNAYASGHLTLSSYGAESFNLAAPRQIPILLSYERGLFTYYPWAAVALITAFFSRRVRPYAFALTGLVGAYVVLYGFWHVWCLGGGFGHRGFVELMPAFILCFGVAMTELRRAARFVALGAALLSTAVTVELLAGYWRRTLDYNGTTARVYWAHVLGKNSLLPIDVLHFDRGPWFHQYTCR